MKITVIGAGLTGLLSAYYLAKAGFDVEMFEKDRRLGGLIETMQTEFGPMDYAAGSVVNSLGYEAVFADIGLELAQKGPRGRAKNVYRGKITRWPMGASESMRLAAGLGRLGVSPNRGLRDGQTVSEWGGKYLGKAGYRYLLETFLQGIYAGDGNQMSAPLILGPMFGRRKAKGKPQIRGSVMPSGGMGRLIEVLANYLEEHGVIIHSGAGVRAVAIDPDRPTVIATAAPAAGRLLGDLGIEGGRALAHHDMLSLASVHLVFDAADVLFDGFGCLFPVSEGFKSLGVLSGHNSFPGEYSQPAERWIIGGAHNRDVLKAGDGELIGQVLADRRRLAGRHAEPVAAFVLRRPEALPHYTLGLERILGGIVLPANLHLAGNYLGGIGLTAILENCRRLPHTIQAGR